MSYRNRFGGYNNNRRSTTGYRKPNYRRNEVPLAEGDEQKKTLRYPGLPPFAQNVEPHIVRMIRILHANADIRRYTALAIVKQLIENKVITEEGNYIRFRWDKYTVCSKGINNDYRYTDSVFLKAFVSSFTILSAVASKSLANYIKVEFPNSETDIITDKDVDTISKEIINHQLEADENIANFEDQE